MHVPPLHWHYKMWVLSVLSLCFEVQIATFSVRRRAFSDLEHASRQEATLGVAAAATFRNPLIYVVVVVLEALVVGSRGEQSLAPSSPEPSPLLHQVAKEVVAKTMLVHLHCASPVSLLGRLAIFL